MLSRKMTYSPAHLQAEEHDHPHRQHTADDNQQDHEQQQEEQEIEERSSPSGKIVYHAILKEGEEELERSSSALFWSGLAAGLSMGFSFIAEGLLAHYLPDAHWRPLVAKLGYSVGFLIVVLGRQQLFTENTLTPILPLLQKRESKVLGNVLRLWAVVLFANLLGALVVGWACVKTHAFDDSVKATFLEIGHKALSHDFVTVLIRGIFAGWLIALMVWLLPFAEAARVWVIIIITYVVGVGEFSHVIAGAVETFAVAWTDASKWGHVLGGWLLPTLIGNILGGVTLVAALNHAQVVSGEEGEDM
jgi:formate/nitrite transporter FocA (FNT family)